MNFLQFIDHYQTLIGSFLAIFASILLWFLKEQLDKRKQIKENKKEIENIFFMMSRDAEESVKDLRHYTKHVQERLKKFKDEIHVLQHSRLNRVYTGEERLFSLKQGLHFIASQQIDIALASAKKFNSYMESIETEPVFILGSTVKTVQSGLESREKASSEYKISIQHYANKIEQMLDNDIKQSQINMLRPLVGLNPEYEKSYEKVPIEILDQMLEEEAKILLDAVRYDLK